MKLEGKIWKDGKFWLIEIPFLDLATQGKNKKDAFFMIKDALEILINNNKFKSQVIPTAGDTFYIESPTMNILIPFILKRLRQKNHLTIREVADRLGHKSHTAYARYETGQVRASLDKFAEYVKAIDEDNDLILKVG